MVAMPSTLFPGGTAGADGATPGRYGLLKPGQFKLVYVPEAKAPRLVTVLDGVQCYAEKMCVQPSCCLERTICPKARENGKGSSIGVGQVRVDSRAEVQSDPQSDVRATIWDLC